MIIKNPYSKDYLEIIGANGYLEKHKQNIPKLFKKLEKEMWNKTKNWSL